MYFNKRQYQEVLKTRSEYVRKLPDFIRYYEKAQQDKTKKRWLNRAEEILNTEDLIEFKKAVGLA